MKRTLSAALACLCCASPVVALECRLALVLALDVSSSVDAAEDALQRGGLASALIAPEVQAAFLSGDLPVALSIFEWSGRNNQDMLLDWRYIRSSADLTRAAEAIAASRRGETEFPTAMGYALGFASVLLERGPRCLYKTIDISGDGENNEGFAPPSAYRAFAFDGVTVNGLAINGAEYEAEISLLDYYRNTVLYGPGAFLEVANGFEDYARAMRRKLEREVRPNAVGALSGTTAKPG